MQEYLRLLADGEALTEAQAEAVMHLLMKGDAGPEAAAGLLMGLRTRGETLDELVGFTRVMRAYAVEVDLDNPHAIDLCGTGGDSTGTFNISTAASFVCAGAGATVAKHGNRSVSSQCGSADVLAALGVQVELRKAGVEYCLREAGIAFLFAPFFHPAMRHVMPIRRALGVRTFFNILGPLCNPARVQRQLIGTFSLDVARRMAAILARLDAAHVLTLHADDGMDELSLSAPTQAFEYKRGDVEVSHRQILARDFDLDPASLDTLQGGSAEDNATLIRQIFDGKQGPHRDVVLLNAAYALHTSGRFKDLDECFGAARASLDEGQAARKLEALVAASQEAPRDE